MSKKMTAVMAVIFLLSAIIHSSGADIQKP